MRKTIIFISIILLTPIAFAGVTEKVRFAPGTSGTVIDGTVLRGDQDIYTLKAKSGQRMDVEISSEENNAVFQIYSKNDGDWENLPGASEDDDATVWSDELSSSGSYKIVVGATRGNASYSLTIHIE
jgi:hypothetical protein